LNDRRSRAVATVTARLQVARNLQMMPPSQFTLPIYIDLSATFLYGLTGALAAIRRQYDAVGVFVLALVTGLGGALIRDGIFIQSGPPAAMLDPRYLTMILAGCLVAAFFRHRIVSLVKVFVWADALGLGAYAVVGSARALGAQLSIPAAIMVGIINATGGGLLRDVLVREEPLLFKPGQFYVLAALVSAVLFCNLVARFGVPAERAALYSIGASFMFRILAIVFNWKTIAISDRIRPRENSAGQDP
jgi:uncharacterized membrane protein YeiH